MSEQLGRTLAAAGVPPRFLDRRLETFDPGRSDGGSKALAWAVAFASEPHSGLLAGSVGTGKTHLVVGVLAARVAAWLEKYPEAVTTIEQPRTTPGTVPLTFVTTRPPFTDRFADVPQMLDRMRRWIAMPEGPDPLGELLSADLLVLDDLGREKVTDWATERLYVLVNRRYGELRPTIATTNLRPSELAAAGYEPIVSRLFDGRPALWLGGKDQRAGGGG